jgi:hypothetical protein
LNFTEWFVLSQTFPAPLYFPTAATHVPVGRTAHPAASTRRGYEEKFVLRVVQGLWRFMGLVEPKLITIDQIEAMMRD